MRSLDRIAHALRHQRRVAAVGEASAAGVDVIRVNDRGALVQDDRDPGSAATALTPASRQLRGIEFAGDG